MLSLTPKQITAWLEHLDRPELCRHLFYGGARSGKTDVILTWLCIQAATYPGARILMSRRTRIAAAKSLWSDSLVKMLRGRNDFKMLEIRHGYPVSRQLRRSSGRAIITITGIAA